MRKLTKTAAVVASMAVMAIGAVASVSADELKNTWSQENGTWYYYDNSGNKVSNQWAIDSAGKWYFLGDDGKMVTNAFINDGVETDYDRLPDAGNEEDPIYYVGSDGAMVTGWIEIDMNSLGGEVRPSTSKSYFYFGGSGYMFGEQWVAAGDDWYYLGTDGKMLKSSFNEDDYYFTKSGKMITGWYKLTSDDVKTGSDKNTFGQYNGEEGEYVYADKDGELKTGWLKDNGKWYYLDDNYTMRENSTGPESVDGSKDKYFFKDGGAMATGYTKADDNEYYFFDTSDGSMKTNKFQKVGSRYYYFGADGRSFSDQVGKEADIFYIEETKKNGTSGEKYLMATDMSAFQSTGAKSVGNPVSPGAGKVKVIAQAAENIDDVGTYFKNAANEGVTDGFTYKIYRLGSSTTKTVKGKK